MILARNLFFMSGLFIFIVLMLAFLPSDVWNSLEIGDSYPVYQPTEQYGDELVDFLISQQFALKMKKVESDAEQLIVDFYVTESNTRTEEMYEDLHKLIFEGFRRFPNLLDIRSRIVLKSLEKEQLLVGVIARRDQFEVLDGLEPMDQKSLISFISEHFKVTYGPAWVEYNKKLQTR